jgi:hypothetical protein
MKRSTVLSLPLQSVFLALAFTVTKSFIISALGKVLFLKDSLACVGCSLPGTIEQVVSNKLSL